MPGGPCTKSVLQLKSQHPVEESELWKPSDRYGTLSAIGSAIRRPYIALSRIHTQVRFLNRLVLSHPGSLIDCGARVSKALSRQARNKNAMEAILAMILDIEFSTARGH